METIEWLRKRIDEVDERIVQLLSERATVCRSIGVLKRDQKLPVKDVPRENDVYTNIRVKATALGLNPVHVEAIYRQIVNMCMAVQEIEEKRE